MTPVLGPDLHLHSTASDGVLTPTELVERALALGVPAIAITDHDTVEGVAEALHAAQGRPITVVPAVELSAGAGDRAVHVLGYHIDHTDAGLLARLRHLRAIRLERAERIVHALAADGYHVALADVLALADGGAVGRAHIAQSLVSAGYAASTREAFTALLGSSAPYFVPKPVRPVREVVGWIEDAGGIAVLAHPGLSAADDLVPGLIADGIAGIEAYHGSHDLRARTRYAALAERFGVVTTGGSDYHGDDRDGDGIGSADVPADVTDRIAEAVRKRKDTT